MRRAFAVFAGLTVLAAAGCGGGTDDRSTDGPGVIRVYEVADPDATERTVDALERRIESFEVKGATARSPRDGVVELFVPSRSPSRARAALDRLTTPGRLAFYDWEASVIGPGGKPRPDDADVTGGPTAGTPETGLPVAAAVRRAARRPAIDDGDNLHDGRWYAVGAAVGSADSAVKGPYASREDAERSARGAKVLEVRPGTVVVRARPDEEEIDAPSDRAYVLEDDVALSGAEIVDPEQNFDTSPRGTNAPIVTFDLTEPGAQAMRELTRRIARRARASQPPGTDAQTSAHHFAIVLDDEIVTVPFIDHAANPDGIDVGNGTQIQGGFTIATAQELATLLDAGALPSDLVRPSERVRRGG